jgi:hypothetical protein
VSDRDFIKAAHFFKGEKEGEYYWVNAPVRDHPEIQGYVRGENSVLGWKFVEKENNETHMTMVIQTNFGGYIPQYLVDQALLGAPYTFNEISKVLKSNK